MRIRFTALALLGIGAQGGCGDDTSPTPSTSSGGGGSAPATGGGGTGDGAGGEGGEGGGPQAPSRWSKVYPAGETGRGVGIAVLEDGSFLVSGNTSLGQGGLDAWFLKLDSEGMPLAQVAVGGGGDDTIYGSSASTAGGAIAVGRTNTYGGAWALRVHEDLEVQWQYRYSPGGSTYDQFQGIGAESGAAVMGGTYGPEPVVHWLQRLDGTGATVFASAFYGAGPNNTVGRAATAMSDESLISVGRTGFISTNWYVVRTDGAGEIGPQGWVRGLNGDMDDSGVGPYKEPWGVADAGDGRAIVVGRTRLANRVDTDGWVVVLSDTGGVAFQAAIGGGGDDSLTSVIRLSGGGFLMSGFTNGGAGAPVGWVVKLSATFGLEWESRHGISPNSFLSAAAEARDGDYVLVGQHGAASEQWPDATGGALWVLKIAPDGSSSPSPIGAALLNTRATVYDPGIAYQGHPAAPGSATSAMSTPTSVSPVPLDL